MRILVLFLSVGLLFLSACNEDGMYQTIGGSSRSGGGAVSQEMLASMPADVSAGSMALDRSKFNNRRIAETHSMNIETEPDVLKSRFDRDFQKCLELGCEVQNSNVQSRRSGQLNARIEPQQLPVYLDFLAEGPGELKSHAVAADDKTLQYIDTDAKIKNLEALKARLVKLLDSPKAENVQQILEIERELNRVEHQLDSAKGQLRHLQTITGKATVNVRYSVPYFDYEIRYYDLKNSFKRAWQGFIESIAEVVVFIGHVVPWIPVWFAGLWLIVKVFKFAFGKSVSLMFWKKKKNQGELQPEKTKASKEKKA